MLLDAHLELGPPHEVVKYFEIVKEKWPEIEIPFDKIVKIGDAYHAMGEYERSYMVFRATVESSFLARGPRGRIPRRRGRVPQERRRDEPAPARISAGTVRRLGPLRPGPAGLRQGGRSWPATRPCGPSCVRRRSRGSIWSGRRWGCSETFLTTYPEDPAADEAAFSVAERAAWS